MSSSAPPPPPLSPALAACARVLSLFVALRTDNPEEVVNASCAFGSLFCVES